jgi:hypothetical protein
MDNQIATTLKAAYRICELGPLSGENLGSDLIVVVV